MVIRGNSYDCCSACSDKITSTYKSEGWEFIKRALNERGFVEELSGLAEVRQLTRTGSRYFVVGLGVDGVQVQRSAEKALADMELSDEDNAEDGNGDGQIV